MEWIFWRFALEESYFNYSPIEHPLREKAISFLAKFLRPEHKVLDLGCARGEITKRIAAYVEEVKAIDYNKSLLEIANNLNKSDNIEFIFGEAHEFLKDNKTNFDVLILSHILEHIDEPNKFIATYKNFFSYIYIEVPDFEKSFSNIYREDLGMSLIWTDEDHVSEFDRHDIMALMESNNINIVASEYKQGFQRHWCKVQ